MVHAFVVADVVERADVRVGEARDGARLALQALAPIGVVRQRPGKDLDRDDPIEPRITGSIDLAHAPRAGQALNLVRSEPRA